MGLYERLGGTESPKIAVHDFMSAMQEYAKGDMSGAQAVANFNLSAGEQTEALALRDKILEPTHADGAVQMLLRFNRGFEYENVLILWETKKAPYTTVAAVKARLGVS